MGIANPQDLSRKEYYKAYADFLFLRKMDRDFLFNIIKQAASIAFHGEQE
jgi:hypothetical protein